MGANLEKSKENTRRWKEAHPEESKELTRRWREENRIHVALSKSYIAAKEHDGFPCDPSQEDEIAAAFTGFCHHCGKSEEDNGRRLDIDHDHSIEFGNFRGWLCIACNVKDVLATKPPEESEGRNDKSQSPSNS